MVARHPRHYPRAGETRHARVMNTATGDFPADELRVGDAGRDRAVRELSEAFQAGRITADAARTARREPRRPAP